MTIIGKNNGAFQYGAFQYPGFQVYVPVLSVSTVGSDDPRSAARRLRGARLEMEHNNDILMLFARVFMERQKL